MAPDNRYYDDTITSTKVRYDSTSTQTYMVNHYQFEENNEELLESFIKQENFEWRKRDEKIALMKFKSKLPSKIFVKYIPIKQKRFKQKVKY